MINTSIRHGKGRVILVLAAAGLMSSVPVWADPLAPLAPDTEVVQPVDDAPLASLNEGLDTNDDAALYEEVGEGEASYYGKELAGNRTASGERFDPADLTAAHRTLPLGSKLRVTNKANGKSVIVRVNDRGPFSAGRIIDVSLGAARQISMVGSGTADVRVELMR